MPSSPSGYRSLCLHFPHLNDVWHTHLLPYILPNKNHSTVLYMLTVLEFETRMRYLSGEITGRYHVRYRSINDGHVQLTIEDVCRQELKWSAGFLPPTFPHYNTYWSFNVSNRVGGWGRIYEIWRFTNNVRRCCGITFLDWMSETRTELYNFQPNLCTEDIE